jgi:eukaryotic-like serine/threonine-protein kinase
MTGSRSRALVRALAVITLGAVLSSCGETVSTTSTVTSSVPGQGSSPHSGGGPSSGPPVTSTTATSSSSTPATITVPDVNSQPLADAIQILTQAGLTVGQQEQRPNLIVPHQSVITTDPAVGTPEPAGFAVELIISAGPPGCPTCGPFPLPMPDVVGQGLNQAITTLAEDGLTVGSYSTSAASLPAGEVIESDPAAEVTTTTSIPVVLVVSSGLSHTLIPVSPVLPVSPHPASPPASPSPDIPPSGS